MWIRRRKIQNVHPNIAVSNANNLYIHARQRPIKPNTLYPLLHIHHKPTLVLLSTYLQYVPNQFSGAYSWLM